VPFCSFKSNLFNDAAVTLPTPMSEAVPVETRSTALSNGWAWSIPLTNRFGNGYVYSRDFLDPDAAELELRRHLGLVDAAVEARHLRFEVGQLARHWERNCIAIGLAQGFIEPLEATALHLVLNTVDLFITHWERGDYTDAYHNDFNAVITGRVSSVRDYIVAHYKLNTRDDTEYWRANRANSDQSDALKHIIEAWDRKADLAAELSRLAQASHFGSLSWHCLLAGYGRFPKRLQTAPATVDFHEARGIGAFLAGCSLNFQRQSEVLASRQ
jgi:hypothetical protein